MKPQRGTSEAAVPGHRVLTVRELSDYLRVHPSTIYRLLRRNRLPAFRIGGAWRFNIEAVNQWIRKARYRGSQSQMSVERGADAVAPK